MERKFKWKVATTDGKLVGTISTENELAQIGIPAQLFIDFGFIEEIIEAPEPETEYLVVRYNSQMGYFVSRELLNSNPHKEGSENWHRHNNRIPLVEEKKSPKPVEDKIFSVKDIQRIVESSPSFNMSTFARKLGREVIESALSELI